MSTSSASRKPKPPHLGAVLELIIADKTLPIRQRQDMASALRTVGKALGRPLDELRAHPASLRERLAKFTPAMANLSERRWTNVVSLVRSALTHVGITHTPARSREPFAPEWTAAFRHIKGKYTCTALSRLARYCSGHGIDPGQVNDATLRAFLDDLTTDSLVKKPRDVQRKAAVVWNRFAGSDPNWPTQQLTVPDYRRTFALPWAAFPSTLKSDIDAYLDHLAGRDILAEIDFRPLRPASIRTRTYEIRAYISALVHRGCDPQTFGSLRDVVAVETVKTGIRFFLDRAPNQSTAQACSIARVITSLARHWVKVDPEHLATLQAICKRLDPGNHGLAQKNRDRLRQFDDPENLHKLLLLPERLVSIASRSKQPSKADALLVQTAVAVELLLMIPMRRKNLTNLEIGRHLIRSRKGTMQLAIPGPEVKNGTPIEAILPPHVTQLIDLYVTTYRPLLITKASAFLFPGARNGPKTCEGLAQQISDRIKERCGLLVNPHLFRHIAAKLYLEAHPGAYGVIRLLHGHKSVETTTEFYCGTESTAAVQYFDAHVLHLRANLSKATGPDHREGRR